jgi:hypothetical protein
MSDTYSFDDLQKISDALDAADDDLMVYPGLGATSVIGWLAKSAAPAAATAADPAAGEQDDDPVSKIRKQEKQQEDVGAYMASRRGVIPSVGLLRPTAAKPKPQSLFSSKDEMIWSPEHVRRHIGQYLGQNPKGQSKPKGWDKMTKQQRDEWNKSSQKDKGGDQSFVRPRQYSETTDKGGQQRAVRYKIEEKLKLGHTEESAARKFDDAELERIGVEEKLQAAQGRRAPQEELDKLIKQYEEVSSREAEATARVHAFAQWGKKDTDGVPTVHRLVAEHITRGNALADAAHHAFHHGEGEYLGAGHRMDESHPEMQKHFDRARDDAYIGAMGGTDITSDAWAANHPSAKAISEVAAKERKHLESPAAQKVLMRQMVKQLTMTAEQQGLTGPDVEARVKAEASENVKSAIETQKNLIDKTEQSHLNKIRSIGQNNAPEIAEIQEAGGHVENLKKLVGDHVEDHIAKLIHGEVQQGKLTADPAAVQARAAQIKEDPHGELKHELDFLARDSRGINPGMVRQLSGRIAKREFGSKIDEHANVIKALSNQRDLLNNKVLKAGANADPKDVAQLDAVKAQIAEKDTAHKELTNQRDARKTEIADHAPYAEKVQNRIAHESAVELAPHIHAAVSQMANNKGSGFKLEHFAALRDGDSSAAEKLRSGIERLSGKRTKGSGGTDHYTAMFKGELGNRIGDTLNMLSKQNNPGVLRAILSHGEEQVRSGKAPSISEFVRSTDEHKSYINEKKSFIPKVIGKAVQFVQKAQQEAKGRASAVAAIPAPGWAQPPHTIEQPQPVATPAQSAETMRKGDENVANKKLKAQSEEWLKKQQGGPTVPPPTGGPTTTPTGGPSASGLAPNTKPQPSAAKPSNVSQMHPDDFGRAYDSMKANVPSGNPLAGSGTPATAVPAKPKPLVAAPSQATTPAGTPVLTAPKTELTPPVASTGPAQQTQANVQNTPFSGQAKRAKRPPPGTTHVGSLYDNFLSFNSYENDLADAFSDPLFKTAMEAVTGLTDVTFVKRACMVPGLLPNRTPSWLKRAL